MAYEYETYTNQELRELETDLNKFYLIEKVSGGKEIKFYAETRWLNDNGALGQYGGVIIGAEKPIKYEVLRNKLEQLYKLQGKTEYVKKQESIATEKLAEEMTVDVAPLGL